MGKERIGAVVIGRNEGQRLVNCLESLRQVVDRVVYVDSGSTDGSIARARGLGVDCCELDALQPFTAGRARNAGFRRLLELCPDVEFVQFVDGDCAVAAGWIEAAVACLECNPTVGAVGGRRREIRPDASPYNRVTDMEWNTAIGEGGNGGDVMFRTSAFLAARGFRETMIAGEEPELYLRIRRCGFHDLRIEGEMTLHDAGLERFGQWWCRNVRSGHAYAESVFLHGGEPERFFRRQLLSIIGWTIGPTLMTLSLMRITTWAILLPIVSYGVLWFRIFRDGLDRSDRGVHAMLFATAGVVGKFAQFQGASLFVWNQFVRKRRTRLIEYRRPGA
jgi:GT2 family glycosyltransferase